MSTLLDLGDKPKTEDAIVEASILPYVRQRLDELAAGLAASHAPISNNGFDLEAGELAARRDLTIALIRWLESDTPDLEVMVIVFDQDGVR